MCPLNQLSHHKPKAKNQRNHGNQELEVKMMSLLTSKKNNWSLLISQVTITSKTSNSYAPSYFGGSIEFLHWYLNTASNSLFSNRKCHRKDELFFFLFSFLAPGPTDGTSLGVCCCFSWKVQCFKQIIIFKQTKVYLLT